MRIDDLDYYAKPPIWSGARPVLIYGVVRRDVLNAENALRAAGVAHVSDWGQVMREASEHRAVVLLIDAVNEWAPQLEEMRRRHPHVACVLVLGVGAREPGIIGSCWEIVPSRARQWALERAVSRSLTRTILMRIGDVVARDTTMPPALRNALHYICATESAGLTIERVAGIVGSERTTLGSQWRKHIGRGETLHLTDFLDWVVLIRAIAYKTLGRSWDQVALHYAVHVRTLRRMAERLTGDRLAEVLAEGPEELCSRFLDVMVRRVVQQESPLAHDDTL